MGDRVGGMISTVRVGNRVGDSAVSSARSRRARPYVPTIPCQGCDEAIVLRDIIEEKFNTDEFLMRVRRMEETAQINLSTDALELIRGKSGRALLLYWGVRSLTPEFLNVSKDEKMNV